MRGDHSGEGAVAEEGFVVAEANASADARTESQTIELPARHPATNSLLLGTDAPGDVGNSWQLVGALHGGE
jgi:hypothetical protein